MESELAGPARSALTKDEKGIVISSQTQVRLDTSSFFSAF